MHVKIIMIQMFKGKFCALWIYTGHKQITNLASKPELIYLWMWQKKSQKQYVHQVESLDFYTLKKKKFLKE